MATQIQFRRGTKSQHNAFTGATAEVTVNTTDKSLHVHDGTTQGGFELARADLSNHSGVGVLTATAFVGDGSGLTGAGSTVADDTTTNQEFFPLFTSTTSGTVTASKVSTTKLSFNPSSGTLTATAFVGDGSGLTGAGSTVFIDNSTNQSFFPLFTDITTGTITASGISTSKLTYNPSTGTVSATIFNATSDINLKENIKIIEDPIEKVLKINGVSFNWKDNHQSSMGVIAQELEEVLPELVGVDNIKSVNYNGLIGLLIEAIKEQQKQINELKANQ